MESIETFTILSAALTGYDRVELQSTGMVEVYYDAMTRILPGVVVGELLSAWRDVAAEAEGDPDTIATLLETKVLEDPKLGDVARNLVSLWYLGQWNQMPLAWRNRHGASAEDVTHVISAKAYREGLVWDAIGAHPMGAKQQGFGAWALPPKNRGAS